MEAHGKWGWTDRPVDTYACLRTFSPLTIDGDLTKRAWRDAPRSRRFVDLVTGGAAVWETYAACLWDEHCLYVAFWVSESDVQARATCRDDFVFLENDVEVFIAGESDAYYEFQLNANNVCFEAFYVWQHAYRPGSRWDVPEWDLRMRNVDVLGGYADSVRGRNFPYGPRRWVFRDFDFPGLRHAVRVDGTLNDSSDVDRGWTAEIAFPWSGLKWLAGGRSLPPSPGDRWRIDVSRFQRLDQNGRRLDHSFGMSWTPHGVYDSHVLDCFTEIVLSESVVP
jgi:hypothetical protein